MNKSKGKKGLINRYKFILILIFLFSMAIAGRLFKTTAIESSHWVAKADSTLQGGVEIRPDRGSILADDGSLLAVNVVVYDVSLDLKAETMQRDTLLKYLDGPLADSLALFNRKRSAKEWREYITKAFNDMENVEKARKEAAEKAQREGTKMPKMKRPVRSIVLAKGCSYSDCQRLRRFPYFNTRKGGRTFRCDSRDERIKPFGSMASRSIGRVGERDNGEKHGMSGLEKAFDSLLYGKSGIGTKVQLANGFRNWAEISPVRGFDIRTTIDIDIQDIVETELQRMCAETEAEWGTAVLMEVKTGEIKAISNLKRDSVSGKYYEGENNAVRGFEPGSVIKPISMMIALEDGLVRLDERIATGKSFPYAYGRPISDSHAYASLTPTEIIAASSNIGMSKVILRGFEKHPGKFNDRLREIGMLDSLHLGIAGENLPYIPELGEKNWDRISLTRISYGYATRIPPIYTLALYNAMANGGQFVRPRLVKELWRNGVCDSVFPVSYVRERICRPEVAAHMRDMLKAVVWNEHGTGRALQNNFVSISGKTGTAYDIVNGSYDTRRKRMAFCGFFPSDRPQYSCIVLMSRPNCGAARSSGKVVMNTALKMYARGMLGNVSDFRNESDNRNTRATLFSVPDDVAQELKTGVGVSSVARMPYRQQSGNGVPSVIGMGLREAVSALERAGLNVSEYEGAGYVCRQSIPAGTKYNKGDKIKLQLKNL